MSGHSKWSKIKRQKAATDAKRSKIWARLARDVTVAAREGGGEAAMNAKLGLAIEKAKAANMPKENIERAIKRGTGEIEGEDYVEMTYEGYSPGGVAVFVEALTENTNRTVADIRHLFNKSGGSLGKSGTVAYLFERKGIIEVGVEGNDELELFDVVAEAGADDLRQEDEIFVITTAVDTFEDVQEALRKAGIEIQDANLERLPTTTVKMSPEDARKVARLIEKLEEHQDVQAVFSTLELDDATVEAIS